MSSSLGIPWDLIGLDAPLPHFAEGQGCGGILRNNV